MTDDKKIFIERDPIDGCVVRFYDDPQESRSTGVLLNEVDLYERANSSDDSQLKDAFHALRNAKQQIGIELDIIEPNF